MGLRSLATADDNVVTQAFEITVRPYPNTVKVRRFPLSDEAPFVTGSVYEINGGRTRL